MKKRSMMAIASLATGFVVAAISPSHGSSDHQVLGDHQALGDTDVKSTLGAVTDAVDGNGLAQTGNAFGQSG